MTSLNRYVGMMSLNRLNMHFVSRQPVNTFVRHQHPKVLRDKTLRSSVEFKTFCDFFKFWLGLKIIQVL